jgi:AraC-like DNA-binding protein
LLVRAASVQVGATQATARREVMLARILDFITDELDNPLLSAKFVCRELAVSRSTVFAILGDANITFASHIRHTRLDRCLAQLRDPRLAGVAIGEIASRCGFASQESFTRAFKQKFGSPPGTYRPKHGA